MADATKRSREPRSVSIRSATRTTLGIRRTNAPSCGTSTTAWSTKDEQIRVFPTFSNWTELDIWQYIHLEDIQIVPAYFSEEREVVEFDGSLIAIDDDRTPEELRAKARHRRMGPLPNTGRLPANSGGTLSDGARPCQQIIQEMLLATRSEREGRTVDKDPGAGMEEKKQQGYY